MRWRYVYHCESCLDPVSTFTKSKLISRPCNHLTYKCNPSSKASDLTNQIPGSWVTESFRCHLPWLAIFRSNPPTTKYKNKNIIPIFVARHQISPIRSHDLKLQPTLPTPAAPVSIASTQRHFSRALLALTRQSYPVYVLILYLTTKLIKHHAIRALQTKRLLTLRRTSGGFQMSWETVTPSWAASSMSRKKYSRQTSLTQFSGHPSIFHRLSSCSILNHQSPWAEVVVRGR